MTVTGAVILLSKLAVAPIPLGTPVPGPPLRSQLPAVFQLEEPSTFHVLAFPVLGTTSYCPLALRMILAPAPYPANVIALRNVALNAVVLLATRSWLAPAPAVLPAQLLMVRVPLVNVLAEARRLRLPARLL